MGYEPDAWECGEDLGVITQAVRQFVDQNVEEAIKEYVADLNWILKVKDWSAEEPELDVDCVEVYCSLGDGHETKEFSLRSELLEISDGCELDMATHLEAIAKELRDRHAKDSELIAKLDNGASS